MDMYVYLIRWYYDYTINITIVSFFLKFLDFSNFLRSFLEFTDYSRTV